MGFVIFLVVAAVIVIGAVYLSRQGKEEIARTGAAFDRIHEENKPDDPMAGLPPVLPDEPGQTRDEGQTP